MHRPLSTILIKSNEIDGVQERNQVPYMEKLGENKSFKSLNRMLLVVITGLIMKLFFLLKTATKNPNDCPKMKVNIEIPLHFGVSSKFD